MLSLSLFIVCVALSSCAGTPNRGSDTPSRSYDAPIGKVYGAAVKAFQNLGLEIFQENRDKGYVEGGRRPGFARGAETVGVFLENTGPNKTTVSIDNKKAPWGLLFAEDWTPKLFDQIEQELKR